MSAFKNEALNQARECWQNAASGFTMRVSGPYGALENRPIHEADIAAITQETQLAIDRLCDAMEILASELDKQT